jgi:hypothetical protein
MTKCKFCANFDFSTARATVETFGNRTHAHISLAGGMTRFIEKEQFKFCPCCGRKLDVTQDKNKCNSAQNEVLSAKLISLS